MKLKNKLIIKDLRKFYFENLWSHSEIQAYLSYHYNTSVCLRTLKRWKKKLIDPSWMGPINTKPPSPKVKTTQKEILRICALRKKTGWGAYLLKYSFDFTISESTYKRIIKSNGLSRGSKIENQRIHWVKWQRDHPDSLWQMDGHKDKEGNWLLPVIDDCSRYCIGIGKFKTLTTARVISYLENLFKIHGVPRELLTDNGVEYGGKSKNSEFDQWCEKKGIKHIRSRVHKPTTAGKIERHHLTFNNEISYCNNDIELFKYRYNQVRPHRSLHMKTPAEVYFNLQIRINGMKFIHSKW
jgi:transposase InsO family protein